MFLNDIADVLLSESDTDSDSESDVIPLSQLRAQLFQDKKGAAVASPIS